ncbi:hypothetical protein OF83DRAFT_1200876 [Amylostereum chailletii]|nr:hypothetical protein OF83DRAFT_1200876 [Amylostereum chailletii]
MERGGLPPANLGSSKLNYAVVDAFGNVLKACFGEKTEDGIVALTDMCAAVVGETIREEVEECLEARESKGEQGGGGEDAEMAVVEEVYEAVPIRFRRWTLVSHALSIVLDTCPPNPTLITCLLDLTLAKRLANESRLLLRTLLTLAIRPARGQVGPLITHPAHTSYLRDLCQTWTHAAPNSALFSLRTLVVEVVDVLVDCGSGEAWTCRALTKFARDVRARDRESFLLLITGLAEAIGKNAAKVRRGSGRKKGKTVAAVSPTDVDQDLRERLARWLGAFLPEFGEAEGREGAEEFTAVVRMLETARARGLHHTEDKPSEHALDLQGALVCTATRCLSSPFFAECGAPDRETVLGLLRDVRPVTSTFDGLVARAFPSVQAPVPLLPGSSPVAPPPSLPRTLRALQTHAGALRTRGLDALEAAFWTCALRRFEREGAPEGDRAAVRRFRGTLMDAVGAAEARMMRGEGEGERGGEGRGGGEWVWEDMVGAWVRTQPMRKRRRGEGDETEGEEGGGRRTRVRTRAGARRSEPAIRTASVSSRKMARAASKPPSTATESSSQSSLSIATPRSRSWRARSGSPTLTTPSETDAETSEFEEEEERGRRKKRPRLSNFTSILADAQKGRLDLREERRAEREVARKASEGEDGRRERGRRSRSRSRSCASERGYTYGHASSDDALDLFAYSDSF